MVAMPASKTLLIELLCEELPPKALATLGQTFACEIHKKLLHFKLVDTTADYQWFASPRRIAIICHHVSAQAVDEQINEKIMPVSVALDSQGKPTIALLKKLESKFIPPSAIENFTREMDGKKDTFYYNMLSQGASLQHVIADIINHALGKLPIPKMMRWGDSEHSFVRPVHKLVILHGNEVIDAEVLGLKSGRETCGHRFLAKDTITLASSQDYLSSLKENFVIADYAARRDLIASQLEQAAANENALLNYSDSLLDEVCSLVEWPKVYVGEFPAEYLQVPQECLILTMQQNQKYFPLFDQKQKLLNRFLIVSNMDIADAKFIIEGNARVVKPRLADARFFYLQDCKTPLINRIDKLEKMTYHNKLGSQGQRIKRLENIALLIAQQLSSSPEEEKLCQRAAKLAKADLVSDMVGEFPELQGTMGAYYAKNDQEPEEVIQAIAEHYRPRYSGDDLPCGKIATIIALADKLESLTGLFSIGQIPSGDKDPYALRRAALGFIRLIIENKLEINIVKLLETAFAQFTGEADCQVQLYDFLSERIKNWLREQNYRPDVIDAVLSQRPQYYTQLISKIVAVDSFLKLDAAASLIAVHKRIGNILKKSSDSLAVFSASLLEQDEEKLLFDEINKLSSLVAAALAQNDYQQALSALAILQNCVDAFFAVVLVNCDNEAVKNNRLSLLNQLFTLLNCVADLGRLELGKNESN